MYLDMFSLVIMGLSNGLKNLHIGKIRSDIKAKLKSFQNMNIASKYEFF